jgi:hypothetical protein
MKASTDGRGASKYDAASCCSVGGVVGGVGGIAAEAVGCWHRMTFVALSARYATISFVTGMVQR